MSSDPEQRTQPDPVSGSPRIERRSVLRVARERLKDYADKLNANARRMKDFLKARK